jgi:hypothetical protein
LISAREIGRPSVPTPPTRPRRPTAEAAAATPRSVTRFVTRKLGGLGHIVSSTKASPIGKHGRTLGLGGLLGAMLGAKSPLKALPVSLHRKRSLSSSRRRLLIHRSAAAGAAASSTRPADELETALETVTFVFEDEVSGALFCTPARLPLHRLGSSLVLVAAAADAAEASLPTACPAAGVPRPI